MARSALSRPKSQALPQKSEPSVVPVLVLLMLFIGGLIGVRQTMEAGIARQVVEVCISIVCLGGTLLWTSHKIKR